jgi:hypothetical protein
MMYVLHGRFLQALLFRASAPFSDDSQPPRHAVDIACMAFHSAGENGLNVVCFAAHV